MKTRYEGNTWMPEERSPLLLRSQMESAWLRNTAVAGAVHYPPYTSNWHPIEHRLFSQIECSLSGVTLDSPQTALQVAERTRTQTGLTVKARLLDRVYQLGRICSDTFHDVKAQFIRHDTVLSKWNYVIDANVLS
jgi:hypothetical protein